MSNLIKMVDGIEVEMTDDEQTQFLAQQAIDITNSTAQNLKYQAQILLDANDKVATRCLKAGVAYPSEWLTYDGTLRAIVRTGTGTIPTQPSYPPNT